MRYATEAEKRILARAAKMKDGKLFCPPDYDVRLWMVHLNQMSVEEGAHRSGEYRALHHRGRARGAGSTFTTSACTNEGSMSDDNFKEIPKRLRKIRRELELSQDNISAIMGKEFHGYISQLERGIKEPRLSTLQSWANALGHEIHVTLRPKEPLK